MKRYHYDRKGRLRGWSSNKLSARDTNVGLLIGLCLVAVGGMCSRDNDRRRDNQNTNSELLDSEDVKAAPEAADK